MLNVHSIAYKFQRSMSYYLVELEIAIQLTPLRSGYGETIYAFTWRIISHVDRISLMWLIGARRAARTERYLLLTVSLHEKELSVAHI